ncbi:MAG: PAS domain-containing protein [Phormidesmis sp. FL-bin-119]|nr:PAS domain-containing protein [Pedobacter sp.]
MENTFGINIIPDNDQERVEALKRYKILDTPPEDAFDNVASLATQIFKVPISLVSLVDAEQVYFKANVGMGKVRTMGRGVSLCSLAVMQEGVTVFENAKDEPCLLTNPNVAGGFGLNFYAGAPITTFDGFRIGTLCIIDKTSRVFDENSRKIMESLARIVMDEIELRLAAIEEIAKQQDLNEETKAVNEELRSTNEELFTTKQEIETLNEVLAANIEEIVAANEELKQIQNRLFVSNIELQESEELKNMAIEQAELGVWHIDASTREFIASKRLKEFFGYFDHEIMEYDAAINHIREDFRDKVANEVEQAIQTGKAYEIEYPIVTYRDKQQRWLRATGKLNPATNGRNSYLSGTIMDVTERKEDDQRKNDFISMVSHELKTPLASMIGYIQMLNSRAAKSEDDFAVGILDKANKQSKKMNALINGFLDMKRVETGKIPIDREIFDMAELLKESEEESMATMSSHTVVFAPVERIMVEADRDKIGQVITNLISNSVKYSPAGSTINVACVNTDNMARVSVKDQGMGISQVNHSQLFDRFYRVESEEKGNVSGFGIGLYICDEIIRRHHGKIWVESELGKGSTFHFTIPI